MNRLIELMRLYHNLDLMEQQARKIFNNAPVGEIHQMQELRVSLWSRIRGEIDTEQERARRED